MKIVDNSQACKRPRASCRTVVGVAALGLIAIASGCTSKVNFGVDNNLEGKTPPLGPGVVVSDAAVIPAGILDADCPETNCSVSWSTDIFPNMEASGAWQCASSSCHGGGATLPAINDGDPMGAFASLATFAGISPAYIVPCNTDTSACSILCNLTPKGCGITMPIGTGTPPTSAQLAAIQTWIGCGSPPN